ncbi:MAG: hypothetical protein WCS65_09365 [Verrucomicrobiae bacterium]
MKAGFIFYWPGRHHLHLILPAALTAAAMIHAGLFFLFSIIYPRQEAGTVDSARVYCAPAGSAESARLAALLESADPAVFAPGRGLPLADIATSGNYAPQYNAARVALDPLPASPPATSMFFPASAPAPVFLQAGARQANRAPLPFVRLAATGSLASRMPDLPPDSRLLPPSGSNPGTAAFLAAVRGDGTVAHLFFQQSSGDEALDKKSAEVLRGIRFANGPDSTAWGGVTFQWGLRSAP